MTSNEQLYAYFKEHTSIKSKKGFRTSTMALDTDFDDLKHIKEDRELERVRRKTLVKD